jgi:large subunit ribosomal protein L10
MNLQEKQAAVDELRQRFAQAQVGILTQLGGIDVATVTELRRQLREANVEYRVVKNTLAKRASKGTLMEAVADDFVGPVGVLLSQDPVSPAKILTAFLKALTPEQAGWLTVKAGVLAGKRIDAAGVQALSTLPSLDELRGKLLGLLSASAQSLVRVLNSPSAQVVRVIDAHARTGSTEEKEAINP